MLKNVDKIAHAQSPIAIWEYKQAFILGHILIYLGKIQIETMCVNVETS